MEFYIRLLTVEEEKEGMVRSRKAQIAIYPVLEWLDDLGVYHDLTLFGSDVDWRSEMNVSIEDRGTRDCFATWMVSTTTLSPFKQSARNSAGPSSKQTPHHIGAHSSKYHHSQFHRSLPSRAVSVSLSLGSLLAQRYSGDSMNSKDVACGLFCEFVSSTARQKSR